MEFTVWINSDLSKKNTLWAQGFPHKKQGGRATIVRTCFFLSAAAPQGAGFQKCYISTL